MLITGCNKISYFYREIWSTSYHPIHSAKFSFCFSFQHVPSPIFIHANIITLFNLINMYKADMANFNSFQIYTLSFLWQFPNSSAVWSYLALSPQRLQCRQRYVLVQKNIRQLSPRLWCWILSKAFVISRQTYIFDYVGHSVHVIYGEMSFPEVKWMHWKRCFVYY